MKRIVTKIGDVFSVKINETQEKYFQLISFDLLQLNSDVIRVFKKVYESNNEPLLNEIIDDEVINYAHCSTKHGIKLNLWDKVGNISEVGRLDNIIFRNTNDYGYKVGEEPIKISNNWHIWKINADNFTRVGKLTGENRNSYVGLVFNPFDIIDIIKGNEYLINYPDFE